jgi:hypothetical protein
MPVMALAVLIGTRSHWLIQESMIYGRAAESLLQHYGQYHERHRVAADGRRYLSECRAKAANASAHRGQICFEPGVRQK